MSRKVTADDIMDFLDWAVESKRIQIYNHIGNPVSTKNKLPAGWGAGADEDHGLAIYFRVTKPTRTEVQSLAEHWVGLEE